MFRHFSSGVIDSEECTAKNPNLKADHAVLVVGSGTKVGNQEYFIIKNSFSKAWGDKGYARVAANVMNDDAGICGILTELWQPSYPSKDE